MGGKSSKITDPNVPVTPELVMIPYSDRKCRDVLWIILFLAYWVVMVYVALVAFRHGDPARLLYAVDSEGNQCGGIGSVCYDGQECGNVITYPNIDQDLFVALQNGVDISDPTQLLSIPFTGYCQTECPNAEDRDWVCSYSAMDLLNSIAGTNSTSPEIPTTAGRSLLESCQEEMNQYPGMFAASFLTDTPSRPCKTLMEGCYKVFVAEADLFFRCVPQNTITSTCSKSPYLDYIGQPVEYMQDIYGNWVNRPATNEYCGVCISPYNNSDGTPMDPSSSLCKAKSIYGNTTSVEVKINPVFDQVNTWSATAVRWMGDVKMCVVQVFGGGAGIAFGLGLVWLVLLRFFASIFVWVTIWGLFVGMVFTSVELLIAGGVINGTAISSFIASETGTAVAVDSVFTSTQASQQKLYEVLGYISCVLSVIYLLVIMFMWQRIRLATKILQEATKAVAAMPLILFFPFFTVATSIAVGAYCAWVALYVTSSGTISFTEISSFNISYDTSGRLLSNSSSAFEIMSNFTVAQYQASSWNTYMFLFNFFGFLWTNQVIAAVSCTTIAGAIASWYWASPDPRTKRSKLPKAPVFMSFLRVLRFHMGSMIFGAFIIAVVQFIRACLAYLDKQTKDLQKKNKLIMILMKVVQCCLWCFEKILKFISKNAYIIIAIKGTSFCSSTKTVFRILFTNMARIAIITSINNLMMLLAKFLITLGSMVFTYIMISNSGLNPSSYFAPLSVAGLLAWFVATSCLGVYALAVDTITISLCEDEHMNDGSENKPYYMSKALQKIVNKSNKQYNAAQEAKQKMDPAVSAEETSKLVSPTKQESIL